MPEVRESTGEAARQGFGKKEQLLGGAWGLWDPGRKTEAIV